MSTPPTVFELSDVAEIVSMPISTAKNWVFGRPLRIVPSVMVGRPGTRNLYGMEDVYRMALAYECNKAGMPPKLLKQLLEQLPPELENVDWLRMWRKGKGKELKLHLQVSRADPPEGVMVWQTVRLTALREHIQERIQAVWKQWGRK